MQGHLYTAPMPVEQNNQNPVYTELRSVHRTFYRATPAPVDRNAHEYLSAYDHCVPENYVYVGDMSNHNEVNKEGKRNVYQSRPVLYQSPEQSDYPVNENRIGGGVRSHCYHQATLPDIGCFFSQKHHQSEKGVTTCGSAEGSLYPVRITPKDVDDYFFKVSRPSYEETVKYQTIDEMIPWLNIQTRYPKDVVYNNTANHYPSSDGKHMDTSLDVHQTTYNNIRTMTPCSRHTETEKPKYSNIVGSRSLMKPVNNIYRTRSTEKPFHCPSCPKSFSQTANLTAHKRIHSGEKPFQCKVCYKKFTQSSSVKTHMRVHTGERPYGCGDCGKTFADSSTLTKHKRIHSGDKPYQCHLCSQKFSQSGNLNRHTKVHNVDRIA